MSHRAFVVGSGPNGLAAAITLAQAGLDVTVFEAAPTPGGGMRSAELTLPGFIHDVCSAIHPMALASPFFNSLALGRYGLEWIDPPVAVAHPLDDGTAATIERSLSATCASLGIDGDAYRATYEHLVDDSADLLPALLAPLLPPKKPFAMARFAMDGLRSVDSLARSRFRTPQARALLAGLAAHSILPLETFGTASFALVLGMVGHTHGWPFARGGSQSIVKALVAHFESLGGTIVVDRRITSARDVDGSDIVMFDVAPRQLIEIGGDRLPTGYRDRLDRFRQAPGVFKLDWALSAPIPWTADSCRRAGTVHVGGTLEEIAISERAPAKNDHAEKPFVLVAQPTVFDNSRAPSGRHIAWGYCHVPNGSPTDMTARIEAQIERFAPGFRETILSRRATAPAAFEAYNANYVGGDVVGGSNDLFQTLARPMLKLDPYAIPVRGWYICSASTPPGGGVHGMCGHHAALSALRHLRHA